MRRRILILVAATAVAGRKSRGAELLVQHALDDTLYAEGNVVEEQPKADCIANATVEVRKTAAPTLRRKYSLFQKGDGSETDEDGIPIRYLVMQQHNRELAKVALQETLEWRKQHDIDTILLQPRPNYDVAKAVFPHSFVGRDKNRHVIFIQQPNLLSLELADKNGLTSQDLLDHYVYVNEYLWQIVESDNAVATMLGILDLDGLNLSVLRKTAILKFLKIFVSTMDSHYPQRADKTILVNAPKWFHVLFKIIAPLLRESTKERILIHKNGKVQDALLESLVPNAHSVLPGSFFSKHQGIRDMPPVLSDLEQNLREYTVERLKKHGQSMQQVVPL